MEKINQLIFSITVMVVVTTCMTGTVVNEGKIDHLWKLLSKKLQGTDCVQTTIHEKACHEDHCHNSSTYIHGCDIYDQLWDNLTVRFDLRNATGWRNTTCTLRAAWEPPNSDDDCGFANLTFHSCTNGDCRNGTTDVRACYSSSSAMNYLNDVSIFSGLGDNNGVADIFDIPCVNLLYETVSRRRHFDNNKKSKYFF